MGSGAIAVGAWDVIDAEARAALDESTDTLERNYLRWTVTGLHAWRGEDVSDEVRQLVDWAAAIDDRSARDGIPGLLAEVAFGRGENERAADLWLEFGPTDPLNAPFSYSIAGIASLILRDAARTHRALDGLAGLPARSALNANTRRLLAAGIAALEGRTSEGLREGIAALGEYDRMGLPWVHAIGTTALVAALGGPVPELRDAAQTAHATLVRLRAQPFVDQLDALLARSPDGAPVSAARQSESVATA